MKRKSIRVNFGRTVNMGDFNNVRLDMEVSFDLEENEDEKAAYLQAFREVFTEVNQKADQMKKVSEKFKGVTK